MLRRKRVCPIVLDETRSLSKSCRIARHVKRWTRSEALERIKVCRVMLEDKLKAIDHVRDQQPASGEFSEVVLDDEQVKQFQRYLIYNHAAGIGDPIAIESVRAPSREESTSMLTGTPAAVRRSR